MYYKRVTLSTLTKRLSREERNVYSICKEALTLENIADKTSLHLNQVTEIINCLISEGLINGFDSKEAIKASEAPRKGQKVGNSPETVSEPDDNINELRGRLKSYLEAKLPLDKANNFIEQLNACSSEEALREQAQIISKKITLSVNVSAGKELLSILNH